MKAKGLHQYRFKDNPEERRFAEEWDEDVADNLKYLLCPAGVDQRYPPKPSERDEVVAATVIQWLGSTVGQSFLAKLGYERKNKK